MRYIAVPILAIVLVSSHAAASDESVAEAFFPESLVQSSAAAGNNVRLWSQTRVTYGSAPYLAVAYSNGISGVVRLLRVTAEGASLVSEHLDLDGAAPRVETVDIDGDNIPEVVASYRTGRRGERTSYLYRWDGSKLSSLWSDRGRDAGFVNATFSDLDGDGILEILEPQSTAGDDAASGSVTSGFDTYKFVNGSLRVETDSAVIYLGMFQRMTGAPKAIAEDFPAPPGPYVVRVINGDQAGKMAVDSAEIRVNGIVVLSPSQFKPGKRVVSVPVTLSSQNSLSVELRSAPKSMLTVAVFSQASSKP
jgi:hypothetical protein